MNTINSYAHSFKKRKTTRGEVFDVVFRVIDETGVAHQKVLSGFATKKLGEKAYMEYVSKKCIFKEKDEEFKRRHVKFDDAAKAYLEYSEAVFSVNMIVRRREYFKHFYLPFFKGKNIATIRSSEIHQWMDSILGRKKKRGEGKYSPRTLKTISAQLNAFFSWCSKRYNIKNPMTGVALPKIKVPQPEMSFWSVDQFRAFIAVVDNPLWRTFFMFQFFAGCRIGETLALQEQDYTDGAVRINKSLSKKTLDGSRYLIKSTKTGKARTVPLPSILEEQLKTYLK